MHQESNNSEFKTFHPIINFAYFIAVISFSMIFLHPILLCISFVCSFLYSIMLNGKKAIKFNICLSLPLILFSAIINPLFNHIGATIILYFPNGNPLTFESIIYGIMSGLMIANVIFWFSCYNSIMTSDKFIHIFGNIIPALSLVLSMCLRFIPRFNNHIKELFIANKCMNKNEKGIYKKLKNYALILSAMISWSFENSIYTADSMKCRGYGKCKRTNFSIFKFDKRDFLTLLIIGILSLFLILKSTSFSYFPIIDKISINFYEILYFVMFFALCAIPIIIEIMEDIKWKLLKSKI